MEQYLYEEAEDGTLFVGATIDTGQTDDVGNSVLLDAQSEGVRIDLTAGTYIWNGRYKCVIRVKDTAQITNDLGLRVQNTTDSEDRNADMGIIYRTATSSFAYYEIVFDVREDDVTGGDNIRIFMRKEQTDTNSIYVDYFLILPLFNGWDWPGDLASARMNF